MNTAKVFSNGGSQAIRLPKECRFEEKEVLVNKVGKIVILSPLDDPWASIQTALSMFTEDFLADGIPALPVQERAGL